MRKVTLVIGIAVMLWASTIVFACDPPPPDWEWEKGDVIKAGQTIYVGDYDVYLWSGVDNLLKIEFTLASGWCLVENHIVITTDILDSKYVNKKDNPKIGRFPFEASYSSGKWVLVVDLDEPPVSWDGTSPLDIALNVVVRECGTCNSETGWGYGDGEWGSSWGWYFDP